jgi:hypothetical protein
MQSVFRIKMRFYILNTSTYIRYCNGCEILFSPVLSFHIGLYRWFIIKILQSQYFIFPYMCSMLRFFKDFRS